MRIEVRTWFVHEEPLPVVIHGKCVAKLDRRSALPAARAARRILKIAVGIGGEIRGMGLTRGVDVDVQRPADFARKIDRLNVPSSLGFCLPNEKSCNDEKRSSAATAPTPHVSFLLNRLLEN